MRQRVLAAFFVFTPVLASAQATDANPGASSTGAARAMAVSTRTPPVLDGRLNDEVWQSAPVVAVFTQRDPDEGAPVSERTEVRFVYDDEAVYVGARLFDRNAVTTRLGRRDMDLSSSDWFRVSFDSYLDRRTAYRFDVNPSGVRRDSVLVGGTGGGSAFTGPEGDLAWDPVWNASASVDADGWSAELRIPFSQLRFVRGAETWGVQIERVLDRRQELSLFSFTRKSEPGGVSAFGDLTGLSGLRAGRRLELMPYVLSGLDLIDAAGNPLRKNREWHTRGGLDARYSITSNLRLTATMNPDFGQVEVDPAVINLTAFETRFEERRPFFVEGAGSFSFAGGLAGPSALARDMFYSRRIGRAPQLGLDGPADVPETASILGAAKITGKTSNGWSVGILNATTGREDGRFIDGDGRVATALTEPRTNYTVARLNRELRAGQTTFGPIFTVVQRDMNDPRAVSRLHSDAYTGGADVYHEWAERSWNVAAFVVGSHVNGSADALLRTQRSSTRYFQRPDAKRFSIDPTRSSLDGFAASTQVRKVTGTHWTGDFWVATTSPGFEMNDIGFQQRADRHAAGGGIRYQELRPGRVFRNWNLFTGNDFALNWDGDLVDARNFISGAGQFLNYWTLSSTVRYEPKRSDDRFTRGGPIAGIPDANYIQAKVTSDPRRAIGGSVQVNRWRSREAGRTDDAIVSLTVRTSPRWNLAVGPSYTTLRREAQYVTSVADARAVQTYGTRYIFAPIDQTEFGVVTRLNYTFTRDLTLELYMQPLVSHADYGTPKEFRRPGAYEFDEYGAGLGTIARDGNKYVVEIDGPQGASSFTVPDRSFTSRSLRGNAGLRWDDRPGSTMFLVWQQQRLNDEMLPDFGVNRALRTLFDTRANNVVVLKFSYWLNP